MHINTPPSKIDLINIKMRELSDLIKDLEGWGTDIDARYKLTLCFNDPMGDEEVCREKTPINGSFETIIEAIAVAKAFIISEPDSTQQESYVIIEYFMSNYKGPGVCNIKAIVSPEDIITNPEDIQIYLAPQPQEQN